MCVRLIVCFYLWDALTDPKCTTTCTNNTALYYMPENKPKVCATPEIKMPLFFKENKAERETKFVYLVSISFDIDIVFPFIYLFSFSSFLFFSFIFNLRTDIIANQSQTYYFF